MSTHEAWLHAPGPRERREARCPVCSWSWAVEGHTEHALWYPEREEDVICEECRFEGEL